MTALNYNYITYNDFNELVIKHPELGSHLVKEYGKDESWMNNAITLS